MRLTMVLCVTLMAVAAVLSCSERARQASGDPAVPPVGEPVISPPACDSAAARVTALRFGEQLRLVSLLAPDTARERAMHEAYGPYVTDALMDNWLDHPASAPGRNVSSPWPGRVDVDSVGAAEHGDCIVTGHVIYVTSAGSGAANAGGAGNVASRQPVRMTIAHDSNGWRISAYVEETDADGATSATDAVAVVRRYYDAIEARDYRTAYSLWANGGRASNKSFDAFAAGFQNTAHVSATTGVPSRIEPAAGSRYIEVPVVVRATDANGDAQRFTGTYTLRRSVVDGATAEQRRWRLSAASLTQAK